MKTIKKGDVVHITSAEEKHELLVTDVGDDGRCSLAFIGALRSQDSRFLLSGLTYIRTAIEAEKRSTDPKWTKW